MSKEGESGADRGQGQGLSKGSTLITDKKMVIATTAKRDMTRKINTIISKSIIEIETVTNRITNNNELPI